ncbi:hypothetical protein JCM8547_006950 [Rhodosporidiobolus lusitaniae]
MPPAFGSSPSCPTCSKPVYFAERALGPGGGVFHKLCLKCVACGKLLQPGSFVDHDGLAYCKPCHGKAFGAKGYGAGGALVGEYAPRSPAASPANASPARATISKPDFDEDDTRDAPVPAFKLTELKRTLPTPPVKPIGAAGRIVPPVAPPAPSALLAGPALAVDARPPPPPRRPITPPCEPSPPPPAAEPTTPAEPAVASPAPASPAPPSPPPPAHATLPSITPRTAPPPPLASQPRPSFGSSPSSTFSAPPPLPPAAKPNAWGFSSSSFPPSTTSTSTSNSKSNKDLCPRCRTVVYFAEEVRAVGSKWHKRCLRCVACGTTLLPNTVTEREGEPFCKRCYGEKWGLGGQGVMSVRLREQDHLPPPPSFSCFRTSPLAPLSAVPSLSITPATPVPTLTEAHRSPLGHAGPLQHADEHGFTSVPISTFEVDDEKEQASTSTRRAESLVPSSRRFHRPSDTPSTTLPPVLPFTDPFSPLSPPAAAGKSTRRPRYLFFIPLLILVLVGIAVGLAVDLSRGSQGNVAPSGTKGGVPPSSLLPSAAPVTVMELAEQQYDGARRA